MKLTTVKLAALVFLVGALALPVLPNAADAAESQATYKVENLNDSELKMTFEHADVHIGTDGNNPKRSCNGRRANSPQKLN